MTEERRPPVDPRWERLKAIEAAAYALTPELRCSKQSVVMPDETYPEDYTWTTCISRGAKVRCTVCELLFSLALPKL